jgi:hypothetical protein
MMAEALAGEVTTPRSAAVVPVLMSRTTSGGPPGAMLMPVSVTLAKKDAPAASPAALIRATTSPIVSASARLTVTGPTPPSSTISNDPKRTPCKVAPVRSSIRVSSVNRGLRST